MIGRHVSVVLSPNSELSELMPRFWKYHPVSYMVRKYRNNGGVTERHGGFFHKGEAMYELVQWRGWKVVYVMQGEYKTLNRLHRKLSIQYPKMQFELRMK